MTAAAPERSWWRRLSWLLAAAILQEVSSPGFSACSCAATLAGTGAVVGAIHGL